MREIKFRAWDNGNKWFAHDIQRAYDGLPGSREYGWAESFDTFLNEPEFVVEQYTGIRDKNGREIYEGDIVRFGNDNWAQTIEVKYGQFEIDCCGCCYQSHVALGFNIPSNRERIGEIESEEYEVIGNIHEPPKA